MKTIVGEQAVVACIKAFDRQGLLGQALGEAGDEPRVVQIGPFGLELTKLPTGEISMAFAEPDLPWRHWPRKLVRIEGYAEPPCAIEYAPTNHGVYRLAVDIDGSDAAVSYRGWADDGWTVVAADMYSVEDSLLSSLAAHHEERAAATLAIR
jgi:hypothetical protein